MILYLLAGWLVFAHTVLLTVFTCLKHKKKRLNLGKLGIDTSDNARNGIWPILSAHRGGSKERTENTLSAFNHAISLGINLLECDVHLTKDGVVIVAHDSDLLRICGVPGNITDYEYADLPPIAKEFPLHFWSDTYKMRPEEDGKFTTLRELFEAAPDRLISIDLKGSSEGLSRKVDSLVREFKREDITIWGSMKHSLHKTLPTLNPETPRFFSGL
jgi:glycerophosphoryl diester phosphodiesterase